MKAFNVFQIERSAPHQVIYEMLNDIFIGGCYGYDLCELRFQETYSINLKDFWKTENNRHIQNSTILDK